jgi:hypothetical protein
MTLLASSIDARAGWPPLSTLLCHARDSWPPLSMLLCRSRPPLSLSASLLARSRPPLSLSVNGELKCGEGRPPSSLSVDLARSRPPLSLLYHSLSISNAVRSVGTGQGSSLSVLAQMCFGAFWFGDQMRGTYVLILAYAFFFLFF